MGTGKPRWEKHINVWRNRLPPREICLWSSSKAHDLFRWNFCRKSKREPARPHPKTHTLHERVTLTWTFLPYWSRERPNSWRHSISSDDAPEVESWKSEKTAYLPNYEATCTTSCCSPFLYKHHHSKWFTEPIRRCAVLLRKVDFKLWWCAKRKLPFCRTMPSFNLPLLLLLLRFVPHGYYWVNDVFAALPPPLASLPLVEL